MNRIVLDASALLAALNREAGSEQLTPQLLNDAVACTVNLAEVQGKLVDHGISSDAAWQATLSAVGEAVPFSAEHAKIAGSLITHTRPLGLSLADRACLALALELKAPVYTADRSWKHLKIGIRIHVIR
jgi:ribonuclease VapC